MGAAAVVLGLFVASSSVATGTDAAALGDLGDLPLSAEDLALLDALADTATATAERKPWWPAPQGAQLVPRARLVEPSARSVREAFVVAPTVVGTLRGGRRLALTIDGTRIDPIVPNATETWMGIDPRFLGASTIGRGAALVRDPRSDAARLELMLTPAPDSAGIDIRTSALARSADRSAGAFVGMGAANRLSGVSIGGLVERFSPTRTITPANNEFVGSPGRRFAVSSRGRILGASDDWLRLDAGFDFVALEPNGIDTISAHHAHFRASARAGAFEASVKSGVVGYDGDTDATSVSGGVTARYRPLSWLSFEAGGEGALGQIERPAGGHLDRAEAFAGARVDTEHFAAALAARYARYDAGYGDTTVDEGRFLVGGNASAVLFGPLSLRVSASQGMTPHVPAYVASSSLVEPITGHEKSFTVEGGPQFVTESLWLSVNVFAVWLDDTFLGLAGGPVVPGDGRLLGVEAEGRWRLTEDLALASSIGWSSIDALLTARAEGVPTLRWFGAVRYDLPSRDAFFSAYARGTTSSPDAAVFVDVFQRDNTRYVGSQRLGAMAGLALGYGFTLRALIDNVLDQIVVPHDVVGAGTGIDLRVTLAYED